MERDLDITNSRYSKQILPALSLSLNQVPLYKEMCGCHSGEFVCGIKGLKNSCHCSPNDYLFHTIRTLTLQWIT